MNYQINYVRAFSDNYIWIIHDEKSAVVIDAGDATPVLDFLSKNNLELTTILVTHEHADHIGGVAKLGEHYPNVKLIGCGYDKYTDNQVVQLTEFGINCQVINAAGHTDNHVVFLIENQHLFCGDVLFSLGCGRVFTGNFDAAYKSLRKIANLNPNILIYPAHEYTLANLKFTLTVDKNHAYYAQLANNINARLTMNGISLPVELKNELKYNLFLRTEQSAVQKLIATVTNSENFTDGFSAFVALREFRNTF